MSRVICALCLLFGITWAENYVVYEPGNMNLLITAPHGGLKYLPGCNKRQAGCYDGNTCLFDSTIDCARSSKKCGVVTGVDMRTVEVAQTVVDEIDGLGLGRPHLIYNKARRSSIDANRDIEQGCQGCEECEQVYNEFHGTIATVLDGISGPGLLLDIHGQGHKKNSTEFGYRVSKYNLNKGVNEGGVINSDNSIMSLLSNSGISLFDMMTGEQSLGKFLEDEGFKGLPSPTNPIPGETQYKYFKGGFTIDTYGSHDADHLIDGVQIEAPGEVRWGGGFSMRDAYSKALARAIATFYSVHY